VKVSYIATDENLGSILDFNNMQARKNLKLGYYDGLRKFKGYKGKLYYIEPTNDEDLFMNFLLAPGEKTIVQVGETLGFKGIPYKRLLFEFIIPKLALLLDMGKNSTYEEIVIAILEYLAFDIGTERFKIYTFKDFLQEVKNQYIKKMPEKKKEMMQLPAFVRQSDVLARAIKERVAGEIIQELFGDYIMDGMLAH